MIPSRNPSAPQGDELSEYAQHIAHGGHEFTEFIQQFDAVHRNIGYAEARNPEDMLRVFRTYDLNFDGKVSVDDFRRAVRFSST